MLGITLVAPVIKNIVLIQIVTVNNSSAQSFWGKDCWRIAIDCI